MDWVVRNRLSALGSQQAAGRQRLSELAARLGFRCIDGFAVSAISRVLPARGSPRSTTSTKIRSTRPTLAHVTARQEVMGLIAALKLPLDERGQRRAAARAEWFSAQDKPLEVHDILED